MVHRPVPPPAAPPAFDALEFEITDFGSAREALDELPAGVAELARHSNVAWSERRRQPGPSDRALTGSTVEWVMSLPLSLRPQKLSMQFPRLANAIAPLWSEPRAARVLLEGLLADRRGGRRGLPDAVQAEVRALLGALQPGTAGGAAAPDDIARARRLLEAAGYRVIAPGG